MLGLTSEGYEKAVNVINTSRSLLDNVVSGIGFDTDDAKEGVDDLFDYVKEMIKDNVDRQVDALEELKDKYSEIIDLKKESLQASKDEADYQDEVADKVKEMAKLQEKINALALDDSRSSVAKRKELEEQLADAQKELQQTQADEAYDKQTDNLDKMQEAYEKQKDAEIKKLQESIQSAQRLDDAARKYIKENWNTLFDTLKSWNEEYGSHLTKELESSWDKALKAAEKYGDYLTALDAIGSSGSNSTSSSSSNVVGNKNNYDTDIKDGIVKKMYDNSQAWSSATDDQKDALNKKNHEYSDILNRKYHLDVNYNKKTGVWELPDGTNLYDKYLGKLHTGGVVGDFSTLRQDEMIATLQKGEIVLDAKKQKSLDSLMRIASAITTGINSKFISPSAHVLDGIKAGYNRDAVPTTTNNQAVNISFGDTIINGEKGDTLKQHEAINRRMVNEIIDVLKLKK
nr:MAG TPA: chromosome segregation ATPase [Caudoviricetes sp.]